MRAPHRPEVKDSSVDPRTGEVPGEDLSVPPIDPPPADASTPAEYLEQRMERQAIDDVERLKKLHKRVRTPDGRLRRARFIGAVLGLRFERYTIPHIAALLGVGQAQVRSALRAVRADADIAAQLKRMDDEIIPVAVDNLQRAVIDGDMKATMKLLDGRGLFRTHKSIEAQITEQRVEIQIRVERPAHMDPNAPLPGVKPGAIAHGAPKGALPDVDVLKEPEPAA